MERWLVVGLVAACGARATTGVVHVDIAGLELFQTRRGADRKPAAEEKVDLQNEHARAWLEIGKDAPEAQRAPGVALIDRRVGARVKARPNGVPAARRLPVVGRPDFDAERRGP